MKTDRGEAGAQPGSPWRSLPLAVLMLLAATLRLAYLDRPSLFYDEIIVMRLATQPHPLALVGLLKEIDATRAPLHPWLLQGWFWLVGASSLTGRAFSVLCGVLTVPLVDRIGRRAFNPAVGLWAAFLFAISPMQVRYAQEVRMYALLVLETCLAWDLLLSSRDSAPPARQLAFLVCLISLGYTHPLGLFMAAALGIAYLAMPGASQLAPWRWLAIQVMAALAIAPWLPRYLDHQPEFTVGLLPLKYLIGLPIGFIGGNSLTLPGFAALVVYGMFTRAPGRRLGLDHPAATTALLIWFALPPLLLYGHSLVSTAPIFGPPRYTLFVGPAYLILVAHGLAKLPWILRYATALICVILAGLLLRTLVYAPDVKADWRDAATRIRAFDPHSPIVYLTDDPANLRQFVPLRYYLGPRPKILMMEQALEQLKDDPDSLGASAWTIVEVPGGRPRGHAPQAWLDLFAPVRKVEPLPGVELTYYRRRPDP